MVDISVCTTYYDPESTSTGSIHTTAKAHGIDVTNFGGASGFDGFLKTKLIPLRKFLDTVTTSMVMFLDGNDVLITSPIDEIVDTWERISGGKVLVGSELVVWPYPELEQRQIALAGDSPSPYKFVDTGLIIGKTEDVKRVLDVVIDSVPGYRSKMVDTPTNILEDDVGLFVLNMVDGNIDVAIDYGCKVIAPIRNTNPSDYTIKDGKLHLGLTGSTPHIVHCNGHRHKDRARMQIVSKTLLGYMKTKYRKVVV